MYGEPVRAQPKHSHFEGLDKRFSTLPRLFIFHISVVDEE